MPLFFHGFPQFPQSNTRTVTQKRPRLLSTSLLIHHSQIILPFESRQLKLHNYINQNQSIINQPTKRFFYFGEFHICYDMSISSTIFTLNSEMSYRPKNLAFAKTGNLSCRYNFWCFVLSSLWSFLKSLYLFQTTTFVTASGDPLGNTYNITQVEHF